MTGPKPKWIINKQWALDVDPLNWKLYRRVMSAETGEPGGWRISGHYKNLETVARAMTEKITMNEPYLLNLIEHLEQRRRDTEDALEALGDQINTMDGVTLKTPPPGYLKWRGQA